jgi:hypothetical protein
VVGLPLWIEGFLYFSDWRLVFVLLEEQLRERDFAPEVIFQRRNRARETELSWRPTGHRLDHVVCFTPPLSELHAMHALRELGTSVVVVTSLPECFPFHVYALRHRTALRRGFEEWARCGLTTAVSLGAGPEEGDPVPALAAAAGLKWRRTLPPSGRDIAAFLESLTGDPRTGLILDDQFLAASLSRNHPDATLAAMRRCRVMVLRSLELPSHLTEGVRIDGVMFDWERLADRIADDLAAGSLPVPGRPLAVEAAWRPRILVDEVPSAGLTI